MASGGYRPGAGRPRGQKRAVQELKSAVVGKGTNKPRESAPKTFESAMDYAMEIINDPEADIARKDRLAIALLPFQHPKLETTAIGKREAGARAAKTAASGRFGPPQPPKLVVDNE